MTATTPARFYYGWVQVVLAAAAMTATLPGRTYGLGLVKEPLRVDLGIGDVRFGVLNFWAVILGSLVVLPIGWLIDRLGSRIVLTTVTLALGTCVLGMSTARSEVALFAWLVGVRGFGQGALSVVAIALVGKWFRKRAPLAMGVFAVLLGVGFVIPPFVLKPIIDGDGWRAAWAVIASTLFGFAILGWLIARSSPESFGVRPDDPVEESSNSRTGMTLLAALRTPAFWIFTGVGTLFTLAFSAITIDNELLLKERAVSGEKLQETILGTMLFCGLPANILAGWLGKKISLPKVYAVGALLLAGSLAVFPFVNSLGAAVGYAALLGASGGIVTVVFFAIYGHCFGRAHLGAIQAAAQVGSVLASAVGPVLLAQCRESFGRTDAFFFTGAALAVVLALACLFTPLPRHAKDTP